jgi:hypothetical protein
LYAAADIQTVVIAEGLVVGLTSWAISILVAIPMTAILCFGVGVAIFTSARPVVCGSTGSSPG